MKYKDLLNFNPITEVVKFSKTKNEDYQKNLIQTFVFSDTFRDHLLPLIIQNLDFESTDESFGIQVVGNYGTGKSHMMSLISLIAENDELLPLVKEDKARENLSRIAGKFKVLKFELGNTESLWEVITFQLEEYFNEIGVDFSFEGHGPKTYSEKIQLMMAEFEEKYPDKGLMLVIDEMLSYLKGRSTADKLNTDLQVLQALGQSCDASRFKFIFGVQEMIYSSPEFQFAAETLQRVNDRYKDIIITKEDVAYIVKNRLLNKNEHQKRDISKHLDKFLHFFTDMHARKGDYVELFPVHPSYFENFERIRIGKSQREILKTLSNQFKEMMDNEIPVDNPGLLTYDQYWKDMTRSQDLMSQPDVRKIKEVTDTVEDKIEAYFTGVRKLKKDVAIRISNACAIKILQHELNKQHGTNTEHLVDDLCLTDNMAEDRDFLIDIIDSTAQHIITATSGQYFDKNANNGEFHLRIEGGINFDQNIKDYAAQMGHDQKDQFFYKFLEFNLPIEANRFRDGKNIWSHEIDWKSRKTFRDGYIFFGNPNEKTTTHPVQHFYMYFMPLFDESKKRRNHEDDEVYFIMDDLSAAFKEAVVLYGAAIALEARADSSQKSMYRQKIKDLNDRARNIFNEEYLQITKVDYRGNELPLNGYQLPGAGATKEQIFSAVASQVLEKWFLEERPDYPDFSQLNNPITSDNFQRMIRQALVKISNPAQSNRDGEGMLAGLGLWVPGQLDYQHSPYARNILLMLEERGGKVINRDEILECIHVETQLWVSKDFKIEAQLQFLVLATLAALGEVEIVFTSGKSINSTNLEDLLNLEPVDFFAFSSIRPPKGVNEAALREMFISLLGRDLSKNLKDPATYTSLVGAANSLAAKTQKIIYEINGGVAFSGVALISSQDAKKYSNEFLGFSRFCDKIATYTTEAKIKNFPYSLDEVKKQMEVKPELEKVEKQLKEKQDFKEVTTYLQQAKAYIADPDLQERFTRAIAELPGVLSSGDQKKIESFKHHLVSLKYEYVHYYHHLYLKYRISEADNTQKNVLLDSDEKSICDTLQSAEFLPTAEYLVWKEKLNQLKPADPTVSIELLNTAPYQDFNPQDYINKDPAAIKELKQELKDIEQHFESMLRETLEDPMVIKNLGLLKDVDRNLLQDFRDGKIDLGKENVLSIRNAVNQLQRGLKKLEISIESLRSTFNKPLTPDEAIEAFKTYIDGETRGVERENFRIILK